MVGTWGPKPQPGLVEPQKEVSAVPPIKAGGDLSDIHPMRRGGVKSFVDDLVLGRGVVISRAATSLRTVETQPWTRRFVRNSDGQHLRGAGPWSGSCLFWWREATGKRLRQPSRFDSCPGLHKLKSSSHGKVGKLRPATHGCLPTYLVCLSVRLSVFVLLPLPSHKERCPVRKSWALERGERTSLPSH